MKIIELLRGILDAVEQEIGPKVNISVHAPGPAADHDDIARMKILSGLISQEPREYANEPQEMVSNIDNVVHDGTDLNKSKNPADIRTNAASMYPDWQARQGG